MADTSSNKMPGGEADDVADRLGVKLNRPSPRVSESGLSLTLAQMPLPKQKRRQRCRQRLLFSGVLGVLALSAEVSLLAAVGARVGRSPDLGEALPVVCPDSAPFPPLVPAIDQSIRATAMQTTAMGTTSA
jgi:hypothetical protein